jgi:Zn-dependent protease
VDSTGYPLPPNRRAPSRSTLLWVVAALVLAVVLVRLHRVHGYEIVFFVVLVPSIILHEVSHGAVALHYGDDTAKRAGRLTLNPLPHIDPFGTIILPALLVLSGVGAFGWAKPVPVNVSRLRNPRNNEVAVALVGPMVNIAIAVACGVAFRLVAPPLLRYYVNQGFLPTSIGYQALFLAGYANVILAVFNLLPIPPLDGSAVVERFLPERLLPAYLRIRPFTLVVPLLVVLVFPNVLADVFQPFLNAWGHLLG